MRFLRPSLSLALTVLVGASSVATVLGATEREAHACGGCFQPSEDNSIITDHRMVLTVSPQQTTLYDQIRYQGRPSSFAWVLPIKGEALVGVSSDAVMGVLDTNTSVQVFAPPQNCPGPRLRASGAVGSRAPMLGRRRPATSPCCAKKP